MNKLTKNRWPKNKKKKMEKVIPSERKKVQQDFGVNTLFLFS